MDTEEEEEMMVVLAAGAACLIDAEDMDKWLKKKNKRQHRIWERPWLKSRNDPDQINTVYKLQQELLQVIFC